MAGDVDSIIFNAATRYGVNPSALLREGQIESNLNPAAVNKSGAAGLFQFVPSTAREYGLSNPLDPAASADAAARLWQHNMGALRAGLGRDPSPGEVYLAHQQGAGGAMKLLSNPNAPAASLVGLNAVTQNGGRPDMTAGQFAQLWTNRFDKSPNVGTTVVGAPPQAQPSFGDMLKTSPPTMSPAGVPNMNGVAMAYMQDAEQQAHQKKAVAQAAKQAKLAALFAPAGTTSPSV